MTESGTAAVIVAAGRGARAGGDRPKQWRRIAGRSLAHHATAAFVAHPAIALVVLVVNRGDDPSQWSFAGPLGVEIAYGGETRGASVLAGLDVLEGRGIDRVLIHDAARPCISRAVIDRVCEAVTETSGAAPALAVVDALWRGRETVDDVAARNGLWRAQTPQGFPFGPLLAAHRAGDGTAADDVEVARSAGMEVMIVDGEEQNLKVTGPGDFARAEALLSPPVRVGTGFDVHRFGPGDHVMLCGVPVPFDRGLKGHSDADVAMHAATDAIYGALAEGDIGRHFPPGDPKWKGASSDIFLAHAGQCAAARGYRIGNLDVTLICEAPRIGPLAGAMAARLSTILDVADGAVSVKATTSERLGFTGRGEGIAAQAVATLVRP